MQNGSGTRPSPSAEEAEDRSFDIAASLGVLDGGDRASGVGTGAAFGAGQEQVDVEEVFAKFKEGVAKQIGVDDAQSHYDLGVAYKEMGLIEDAIREFDTAARDPKRSCICHSMIGMIQLERGNLNEAIDAFMRGLQRSRPHEGPGGGARVRDRRCVRSEEDEQAGARLLPALRAGSRRASATCRTASAACRRGSPKPPDARRRRGRRRRVRPRLRRHPGRRQAALKACPR